MFFVDNWFIMISDFCNSYPDPLLLHENYSVIKHTLSYEVASVSEIMPCIKIDKPVVAYRFSMMFLKSRIWQLGTSFQTRYNMSI